VLGEAPALSMYGGGQVVITQLGFYACAVVVLVDIGTSSFAERWERGLSRESWIYST
jgi:hypothetical protein